MTPLPAVGTYHPTTFLERGVAMPFTTPLLGAARGRWSCDRALELIVPNPSGGQGVYVMPWTAIASLCRPTLHDKVLNTRIAFLETLTPTAVRAVARATAAEGLAGEGAMQAAQTAVQADAADKQVVINHLLTVLIRQVNLDPHLASDLPGSGSLDLDARARRTVAWLAPRLGQPSEWGVGALDALADIMTGVGVSAAVEVGRIPRLIKTLRTVRAAVLEWARSQRDGDKILCAHLLCAMAELTMSLATAMLARIRKLTDDMIGLLRTWAVDPQSIVRLVARSEWLLDGWEQICLLWNFAPDAAARRVALVEITERIPVLPQEVNQWTEHRSDREDVFFGRRPVALNEDWRTGAAVFDLIARNEQFRAAAA